MATSAAGRQREGDASSTATPAAAPSSTIRYDGDVYEGELKDGKRHGRGVWRDSDGNVYDGEWKDNKMHGTGTFTYGNGAVYEGQWFEGLKHGKGVYRYADGNVYEGQWVGGGKHGKGTVMWKDGRVYEGGWVDGKYHGCGMLTLASGDVYEGQWSEGKRHGKVTWTDSEGGVYEQVWANGQLTKSSLSVPDVGDRSNDEAPAPSRPPMRVYTHERKLRSNRSQLQRLQKNVVPKNCEHCGVDDYQYKLRTCSGCNLALYCSAACQKAARGSHQRICGIISKLPPSDADRLVLEYCRKTMVDLDAGLRYGAKYMDNLKHLKIDVLEMRRFDTAKLSAKRLSSLLKSKKGALDSVSWMQHRSICVPGISNNSEEVWTELRGLKQLRLEYLYFDDVQRLHGIICQQRNALEVLCLHYVEIGWSKAKCRRTFAQAISSCKSLVKLDLQGFQMMDSDMKLMLHDLPNLRVLGLVRDTDDNIEFTDNTCSLIARKCPCLQELSLANHDHLSVRGIRKIFGGCVHLRSFYTTTRKLSSGDIRELLEIAPQLLFLSVWAMISTFLKMSYPRSSRQRAEGLYLGRIATMALLNLTVYRPKRRKSMIVR